MRRTCAEHAHTFYAGPSLIRGVPDDADDVMHAGDAGDAGDGVPQVGPILPNTCNLKILKSKVDGKWMENGLD